MRLIAHVADVCLSDYWRGHHLAHISIPVDNSITMPEFKSSAKNEIILGAIAGCVETESEEWTNAALLAIENLETRTPFYSGPLFPDLEEIEGDDHESVQAFIVFTED